MLLGDSSAPAWSRVPKANTARTTATDTASCVDGGDAMITKKKRLAGAHLAAAGSRDVREPFKTFKV